MLTSLVSMITKSLSTVKTGQSQAVVPVKVASNNPFEEKSNNPFLTSTFGSSYNYGKNQPVEGGYFAGYYNGKPNIVGRKLFIEV